MIIIIIIILLIIIGAIRQKRRNKGQILKLNKRLKQKSLNKDIGAKRQEIFVLLGLEKINSVAFLEVKLLVENHHKE